MKERAFQPSLEFVLETDFGIRNRQEGTGGFECRAAQQTRQTAQGTRKLVGAISHIAAEQLVAAFSGERHSDMPPAHFRKKPDGQRTRVRPGLVRILSHILDSRCDVGSAASVRIRGGRFHKLPGNLLKPDSLIAGFRFEGDRESLAEGGSSTPRHNAEASRNRRHRWPRCRVEHR